MKRLVTIALLLLLLVAALPFQTARASSVPQVRVKGFYALNTSGYAVVNETVSFTNNQTSALSIPPVQLGLGNLSSLVVNTAIKGAGFNISSGLPGGPFTVTASSPLAPGNTTSFTLSSLLTGEVTAATNGSVRVLTLLRPAISVPVLSLKQSIFTPLGTKFVATPKGFTPTQGTSNYTYSMTATAVPAGPAQTANPFVLTSTAEAFFPIYVYQATRTITVGLNGAPTVTDKLTLKNVGTNAISSLQLSPLALPNSKVTVIPPTEPKLVNPVTIALSGDTLSVAAVLGSTIPGGSNLTIAYQYPLNQKYYSISGSQFTLNLPVAPPVPNVVRTYTIELSTLPGISVVQGQTQTVTNANQRQKGTWTFAYAIALGWALDGGVPAASLVFVLLLVGLFVMRRTGAQVEEMEEEESSGERVEAMIKAFDEKTNLINGLWPEIAGMDPNELKKEYFDELRGRLDSFRSRALQRLNEVKQKSTTQKFFDLLNQIHTTEREVDRAAKDKLNLYEQYYMRRMRKEVFDRLLPQYTKRLEKGLNEMSDQLHVVQKEAKLL